MRTRLSRRQHRRRAQIGQGLVNELITGCAQFGATDGDHVTARCWFVGLAGAWPSRSRSAPLSAIQRQQVSAAPSTERKPVCAIWLGTHVPFGTARLTP